MNELKNAYVLEKSRAGIASRALPIQMARMVPITIYLEVLLFKGQTIALYLKYIQWKKSFSDKIDGARKSSFSGGLSRGFKVS
jgi:hypothetical protein